MASSETQAGALVHLIENVFSTDTDALLAFFEYHGVEDINDFMYFTVVDFGNSYSTLESPTTLLSLSTSLIKKLVSVQSWYVKQLEESNDDDFVIFYSLTTEILHS